MGDADDSYDFSESARFVEKLREGYDLVMGCRLPSGGGTIMPGAMPWKNRWLGNPVLSFLGRLFFRTPIRDFHCGLRAFTRAAYQRMVLKTTGMEFASEMVMKASIAGLRIAEVPITLHKDGRSRPPHLRPWRDGWRHLRFMLIYSPRWLFLVPGLVLAAAAASPGSALLVGCRRRPPPALNGLAARLAPRRGGDSARGHRLFHQGLRPRRRPAARRTAASAGVFRHFTLERGAVAGARFFSPALGCCCMPLALGRQAGAGLGRAKREGMIAATTLLVLGVEAIFSSFFMSVLGLKTVTRRPPDPAV